MQQRKRRPQKVSDTCPKCGYCDKCGRANAAPVWPYPVTIPTPYVPPINTWPWRPYVMYDGPWVAQTTVSGTSTAAAQPVCNPSTYNLSGISISGSDTNSIKFDDSGTLTAN